MSLASLEQQHRHSLPNRTGPSSISPLKNVAAAAKNKTQKV